MVLYEPGAKKSEQDVLEDMNAKDTDIKDIDNLIPVVVAGIRTYEDDEEFDRWCDKVVNIMNNIRL